ncbi:acetamidase [Candidatus Bathyarchaeota archaeon]|nr:MAG: acetamidase [Candidatus Bathyarchaeota archaeon]HDN63072.1 acetamidase [Candidatus Bathyarchaeota archaeon]
MEYKFTPKKYYFLYGKAEPALKLKPGDVVETSTVDARGYDSAGKPLSEESKAVEGDYIPLYSNPLVGPFYVEGAEPGDTLSVYIEKVKPNRDYAWSRILPHFGSFTEEGPRRRFLLNEPIEEKVFDWKLDLDRNVAILQLQNSKLKRVEIPLHPFIGSIGVAPRFGRRETALTPGEYGGNMDCIETKEGTTLYLPVFVKGAYLYFGDVHAAQGDGELTGVALEVSADVKLKIDLIKGKSIEWPRLEDEEFIMVAGSSRPLMEALKIAHVELVRWLVEDYGFDKWEAFEILSQVGKCRIGNVVDPCYTVVAKFPKKYLP